MLDTVLVYIKACFWRKPCCTAIARHLSLVTCLLLNHLSASSEQSIPVLLQALLDGLAPPRQSLQCCCLLAQKLLCALSASEGHQQDIALSRGRSQHIWACSSSLWSVSLRMHMPSRLDTINGMCRNGAGAGGCDLLAAGKIDVRRARQACSKALRWSTSSIRRRHPLYSIPDVRVCINDLCDITHWLAI